jgi:hypothetical protein
MGSSPHRYCARLAISRFCGFCVLSTAIRTQKVASVSVIAGTIMRRLCSIAIALLLLTVVSTLAMAAPPTQLYGKSILYRWMSDIDFKTVDGHGRHAVTSDAVGMYISTSGRIFTQYGRTAMRGRGRGASDLGAGWSRDPAGSMIKTSNARYSHTGGHEFKGHTLIVTKVFESGAIRITVNFDESFRTCTVDVVYGKENGAPGIVVQSMSGRLHLSTHKVSGQNCTITDGNMFGGNSE